MHVGAFWYILVHLMCNPMTPPWLVLTPIPFQVSMQSRKWSYKSLRTNLKHFYSVMIRSPFSSILVHFCAPHGRPHHPSVIEFHWVIKDRHPTHQRFQMHPVICSWLNLFVILHRPFSWKMWAKATITYHHLPWSKKSICPKKRSGKYFSEGGSAFTHVPLKENWRASQW